MITSYLIDQRFLDTYANSLYKLYKNKQSKIKYVLAGYSLLKARIKDILENNEVPFNFDTWEEGKIVESFKHRNIQGTYQACVDTARILRVGSKFVIGVQIKDANFHYFIYTIKNKKFLKQLNIIIPLNRDGNSHTINELSFRQLLTTTFKVTKVKNTSITFTEVI